eukprot:TRINITY_DN297_c0_g1_i1.p1 TRINITY_DN297_c0_g1~~TRINITY_DN297_c0_g1_i1.p1  ORF type:complete len:305 (-),score=50.47 TRINITY_DN297_c0_g1_i1:43-957(-)
MADTEWVPLSKRPELADVTPLPQDDGPNPVCPIMYTQKFKEVMDYFRAILQLDERSERAFDLTNEVISVNAANYTAWYFRRILLNDLKKDLKEELRFISEIGSDNPKNYQLWYHRKAIVQKLEDPSQELSFTASMFDEDSKNYHAWAHRQWVIETFKLWDGEYEFIDELLNKDVRNNSAWNQRFFVFSKTKENNVENRLGEIEYAFTKIKKAVNNPSPWLFISGIVNGEWGKFPQVKEKCLTLRSNFPACPYVVSMLVEIFESEGNVEETVKSCQTLANGLDEIRKKYWLYRHCLLYTSPSPRD